MKNFRIAITPSGKPHLGNNLVFFINYILKNKILNNLILRIDNTNNKKNKIINKFYIIKNLKKNGIFFKNIINQTDFIFLYIKKNIFNKKNCYKKIFLNNKIKIKNISYSNNIIINNCKIIFYDNNFKLLKYKIFFNIFIFIRTNIIPTYNYSSIIDDKYNNINLILRGKEWLNQIPFQINLIKKYKLKINFHHLCNINNFNNKKLSKRNNLEKKFNVIFFKKNKSIFFNNKDYKLIINKKKHFFKKNNFIIFNLIYFIKKLKLKIFNFFLNNFFFLKKKFILIFSNLNFIKKIFFNIKEFNLIEKIYIIVKNIKNYEFI